MSKSNAINCTLPPDEQQIRRSFIFLEKGCCGSLTFVLSEPLEDLTLLIEGLPEASDLIDRLYK